MRSHVIPRWVCQTLLALGGALACLCWLLLTPAAPVAAATLHVTDCGDAGTNTLRGRISAASPGDTIDYSQPCTTTLASTLTITQNLTITGPTSGTGVIVDGNHAVLVFENFGATVGLSNLTIQHGNGTNGGAIYNAGTLTLTNCTLSGNSASNFGGGIEISSGSVTVTNSTFNGNSANDGGGINNDGGTLTLKDSTLSGNTATIGGGIDNTATATVTNTIVAGNIATTGPNVAGTVTSGGHNLIGKKDGSTGFTGAGDQTGTVASPLNAVLGLLGSDGGTTPTMPLLAGSPAIGGVPHASCTVSTDQRGLARPALSCAIGAFEPQQATYTVGSTSDSGVLDTFANCQSGTNTTCKLRDALAYAASGKDTITFDTSGRGTITLTNDGAHGVLLLVTSVTIAGPTSGAGVSVDGNHAVQVFSVSGGVTASLSNLTIQHGNTTDGGGIFNGGTVTVTNCTVSSNNATDTNGGGGGIFNSGGTVTLTNSTLSGNSADLGGGILNDGGTVTLTNSTLSGNSASDAIGGGGGGIFHNSGTLTVTNSTLSGNSAPNGYGGGIFNDDTLTMTNITLSGNSADNGGGILNNGGTVTVRNGTLSGNSASSSGGGIDNLSGTLILTNSIVATNTASNSPDIAGIVATPSHNLLSSTFGTTGISDGDIHGDIVSATPLLGALGSNGGPTQTIPLLAGSPALGAGDPSAAGCASTGASGVHDKDQRGVARSPSACDIGAYEAAKTYTVGSTSDSGAAGTAVQCLNGTNTTCRLRDAIGYGSSGQDTVMFNSTGRGTITLGTNTNLTLTASVTISGPTSGAGVAVDGGCTLSGGVCQSGGAGNVFVVNNGVTATLSNLTIQHGNDGGIYIPGNGTLTVTDCTITANKAGGGGAISNAGGGTLTVTNSTIAGNTATAGFGGGGIYNAGTLTVRNSTVTNNSATGGNGGGIVQVSGSTTLTNTIVAGNSTGASGPDLSGTITSGGHNLIGNTSDGSGFVASDLQNVNPLLGAPSSNGGTTQTIPLLTASPAIGHGDPAVCANTSGTAPVAGKDQRGVIRPAALCAIGAFEPLLSAISPPSGGVSGGSTVTLTGAGYAAGASVTIGNVPCTNVQIASGTTLTCTTGAHGAGAADVVVSVGSATGTLTGGYTYGVVSPLPPPQSPGPAGGTPSALPGSRPSGPTGGPAPNPLPAPRP